MTTAYEALTSKDGSKCRKVSEEVPSDVLQKFFNGKTSAGGSVLEAESDEEIDLPKSTPVNTTSTAFPTETKSIYYGPPPPMASKAVVLEYNELGMPRFSYRDISPERREGCCLKMGVPTYKPKVVGRL